ncbi:hypothetical protein ATANTOWER_017675 [Ataeniobius toweri]|uniref:Uncharacterized protein n=1 Tax=Ataeniobius toweri TaxID=208326 RepID=A0ABU7AQT2_9TELE|nr:hypothetical protein [Ataeniobius toweri]
MEESDPGDPNRGYPEVAHGVRLSGAKAPHSFRRSSVSSGKFPAEKALQVKPSGGKNPNLRGSDESWRPDRCFDCCFHTASSDPC